ncbi:DUF3089 domain-containing protein [Sphingomonas arantia]|uniref:DUF3089 domain-containing protein n=1 Tax=Sphingomonas arantia TaxID=1460676 RepID=A0ABW4TTL1_9SPHN
MVRKFLYVIAALITLVIVAGIGWALFQKQLMSAALVPTVPFTPQPGASAPDYAKPAAWLSRPDLRNDPSHWTAPGYPLAKSPKAQAFFITPTTALYRSRWNGDLNDPAANGRLNLFASSQASAFNGSAQVWAPRYRQATIGAFLTDKADATSALDFAYRDVLRAFDAFVAQVPADAPIILAGHSQGSLHLTRLLHDRIAGKPLARRIVAAYVIGWPVSVTADLPALGLPACTAATDSGCILSWQSFAEPADPSQILAIYDRTTGFTGRPRRGTPMLCTNPLTGTRGGSAPATANRGALVPDATMNSAEVVADRVPAACRPDGLLSVGTAPDGFGRFILPGNNYHVFDYAMFWANIRADVATRLAAFRPS